MDAKEYQKYEAGDIDDKPIVNELVDEMKKLNAENRKLSGQLKILRKYQVKKDIDGKYFLAKGIYSIATFGKDFNDGKYFLAKGIYSIATFHKDFKKEAREFKKALDNANSKGI